MMKISAHSTMVASCVGFFALGVITAALGPSLPDLAENTHTNLATVGAVISGLFLGALIALSVAGPLSDRLGQRPVLIAGVILLLLGTLGMVMSQWFPLLLLCGVIAGLGHGTVDVTINVLIAQVFARRSVAALNLLNVFFGLGAVAGPAIASLTLRLWSTALPALWIGIGLVFVQLLLIPFFIEMAPTSQPKITGVSLSSLFRSPLLWVLGTLILLYVGVENGMGNWTATYLDHTTTLGQATAALVTSGFWLALTGGRMIAALAGTRLAPNTLLLITLVGAVAGGALLVSSTGNTVLTSAAVLLMGLCFGPIFPTTIAVTTATFRQSPGTAASMVVAMGSAGGMLFPWLQGILLDHISPMASVMLVAAGTLAMLALHLGRTLLSPQRLTCS